MPMLDAYIPAGALSAKRERALIADLTDLLLRHEGADPTNAAVRQIAWVFLHRPEQVYVAGAPAQAPHYRLIASAPEGQYTAERRSSIVREMTEAVLAAEDGRYERDRSRVWVLTPEVPDGSWGGDGKIQTLADIVGRALNDAEAGRRYAQTTFARRRASTVAS